MSDDVRVEAELIKSALDAHVFSLGAAIVAN